MNLGRRGINHRDAKEATEATAMDRTFLARITSSQKFWICWKESVHRCENCSPTGVGTTPRPTRCSMGTPKWSSSCLIW
ncbi:hypothetical protein D9M71_610240 [compost metagenome]